MLELGSRIGKWGIICHQKNNLEAADSSSNLTCLGEHGIRRDCIGGYGKLRLRFSSLKTRYQT